MRKKIFTGSQAQRERKAFSNFLQNHLKDKMSIIKQRLWELVINDEKNLRTSEILQKLFIEIYDYYIKDTELESELVNSLKIRKTALSHKLLKEIVENLKEKLK